MDVSYTIGFLNLFTKSNNFLNPVRRRLTCEADESKRTKIQKRPLVVYFKQTESSVKSIFNRSRKPLCSSVTLHVSQSFRQISSTRTISKRLASFAVVSLHDLSQMSPVFPRYNRLDNVLCLSARFLVEYYQVRAVFFHSFLHVPTASSW